MLKNRKKGVVSVVISNFNNEEYIRQCLESIVNQSYKNLEIIVIDDASTDESPKIIEKSIAEYKEEFKKIDFIFFKLSTNIGFSGSVTLGLYLSSGEYIAMQDGDDFSELNRIEKQVNYLNENRDIGTIGSDYTICDANGISLNKKTFVRFGVEEIKDIFSQGENAVSNGTILFRGELFDKVGGLTRNLDGAEDYEFLIKLLPYGINNLNEKLYNYRYHNEQRSRLFYKYEAKNNMKTEKDLSILLVLDSLNIGGTETHVLFLAKELIKKGIKVSILSGLGPLLEEFKNLNCKIYNLDFPLVVEKNREKINFYKEKITKILDIENINLIHAHQSSSGSICIETAKRLGIPVVFTIHGMYYHDIVSDKLKLCHSIISVSHPARNWLNNFGINSIVIPNGICFNEFSCQNKKEEELDTIKREFGINKNAFIAMYCSRMAWGKIITCENLIRVCKDLNMKEQLNIHALVVGDGPGFENIKKLALKVNKILGEERIHLLGSKTNLPDLYCISDLVVGTGRVAIEGMASKKTVIATGNDGYVGRIDNLNFEESWKLYFGDHGSLKDNKAIYLYEDIKEFYFNKDNYKDQTEKIFEKSLNLFDISIITDKIIKVYLSNVK